MKFNCIIVLLFLSVTLISCDEDTEENGDTYSNLDIPVSEQWDIVSENPVISFGDSINNAKWNAPSVLYENGKYIMYLTSNVGDFGEEVVPFRAESDDGIQWHINKTPVLARGADPSAIDFNGIESPSVVYFNGSYHMYYTVIPQDVIGSTSIGHATSENGIDWMKNQNNPVLEPTGEISDWNGIQVSEPGAVVYDGKIYLYFSAQGAFEDENIPANRASIGLAISTDGFSFEQQKEVLSLDMPYSLEDGFTGYGAPSAFIYENNMYLFYDVFYYNEDENISLVRVAIHHASSTDGETNWKQNSTAVFTRDMFTWAKREIREPSVVVLQNEVHLWFGGDDLITGNSFWGIGLATANTDVLF